MYKQNQTKSETNRDNITHKQDEGHGNELEMCMKSPCSHLLCFALRFEVSEDLV